MTHKFITLEEMLSLIEEGEEKPFKNLVLAQIIDVATDYREMIRVEDKRIKEMKDNFKVMEEAILEAMWAAGSEESPLLVAGGLKSTARISETEVPSVVEWDEFYKYIKDKNAFHLLQKRAAASAWAEEIKIEGPVPGVEAFTQRKISLRKTK